MGAIGTGMRVARIPRRVGRVASYAIEAAPRARGCLVATLRVYLSLVALAVSFSVAHSLMLMHTWITPVLVAIAVGLVGILALVARRRRRQLAARDVILEAQWEEWRAWFDVDDVVVLNVVGSEMLSTGSSVKIRPVVIEGEVWVDAWFPDQPVHPGVWVAVRCDRRYEPDDWSDRHLHVWAVEAWIEDVAEKGWNRQRRRRQKATASRRKRALSVDETANTASG